MHNCDLVHKNFGFLLAKIVCVCRWLTELNSSIKVKQQPCKNPVCKALMHIVFIFRIHHTSTSDNYHVFGIEAVDRGSIVGFRTSGHVLPHQVRELCGPHTAFYHKAALQHKDAIECGRTAARSPACSLALASVPKRNTRPIIMQACDFAGT